MKYYNITVNGVAYSVSVEETAAGAAPVASLRQGPKRWQARTLT